MLYFVKREASCWTFITEEHLIVLSECNIELTFVDECQVQASSELDSVQHKPFSSTSTTQGSRIDIYYKKKILTKMIFESLGPRTARRSRLGRLPRVRLQVRGQGHQGRHRGRHQLRWRAVQETDEGESSIRIQIQRAFVSVQLWNAANKENNYKASIVNAV